MVRKGSSAGWDDADDVQGQRAGRSAPQQGGRRREGAGRARLSGSQVTSALREAQQLQQEGRMDEAIELCEELLDGGVDRPDIYYFLGWLYQEADRWDEAAAQFEGLLQDPEYALSCYYALGQCARAQGNIKEAAHYFDEAVDRVNLDVLTREESDQLLQLCHEAAEAHRDMNDLEGAETVFSALLGFLRSQNWQDQVAEVERMMHDTLGTAPPPPRRRKRTGAAPSAPLKSGSGFRGAPPAPDPAPAPPPAPPAPDPFAQPSGAMPALGSSMPAAPMGSTPGAGGPPVGAGFAALVGASGYGAASGPGMPGDHLAQLINNLGGGMASARSSVGALPEPQRAQVTQALREISNYVAHGVLQAAIEECLRVLEIAPEYHDVHLLLGEIYVRQGRPEQAIQKYTILANTYLVNGRIDDAIATFQRIVLLEPNNLAHRAKLIELLSRQGRSDEVVSERMAAADAYLRMGYADRAIQEYEQALLAYPNNTQIRLNYAAALMKAGRGGQAVGEYQRILQVNQFSVPALVQWQIALAMGVGVTPGTSVPGGGSPRTTAFEVLGRLLRALRQEQLASYAEVVREFLQALELSPGNPDLRYALGQVHLTAGRTQEALTSFQQLAATPGAEVLARFSAGQALLAMGDPASAAQAVRELEEAAAAVRRTPPDPEIWSARPRADNEERLAPELEISLLLARAYQLSGQVAPMQATLNAVQQQRPHNDAVYQALAEITARRLDPAAHFQSLAQLAQQYRTGRQVENAVLVLKEMGRLAPEEPSVHSDLADIQITRGMLAEGISELRQLADLHIRRGQRREAAAVYHRMAEVSWGSNARDDALNQLRQAVDYAPDEMSLRQQLVQYFLEIGRVPEAAEQQTVISRYYFSSRQTKEAVAALQQLIAMDKHNYDAYDLLGQTYYSVGEYEQAARVYRNLAKVDPNNATAQARLHDLHTARSQYG